MMDKIEATVMVTDVEAKTYGMTTVYAFVVTAEDSTLHVRFESDEPVMAGSWVTVTIEPADNPERT